MIRQILKRFFLILLITSSIPPVFARVFVNVGVGGIIAPGYYPAPVYYGPPSVPYYGPAPYYAPASAPYYGPAPAPAYTTWVSDHWENGYWVPGHYVEYVPPPAPGPNYMWVQGNWDNYHHWHRGYWHRG